MKQYTRRFFIAAAGLLGGTVLFGWSKTPRTRAAGPPRQPFKTVADMLADADGPVGIHHMARPYAYAEAGSGASDSHIATTGGVKLQVLGGTDNVWQAEAFGVSPTNSALGNDKAMAALRNAAIGKGRDLLHRLVYPKGVIQFTSNRLAHGLRNVIVDAQAPSFKIRTVVGRYQSMRRSGPGNACLGFREKTKMSVISPGIASTAPRLTMRAQLLRHRPGRTLRQG